ncbi:MAG: FAD-binding protein [Thermoplasmata archaeon]
MPPLEFKVLGKVVPRSEASDFDPVTLRLRRAGVPQVLNPLDQRALRIALDLRSPGEPVRLLSLGPPTVAPVLAESYALGVDAIDLLSDPAFAGSDTLVTARLLARAVAGASPTILLTGERTTDSETGQVPAQIGEIVGWPLFSGAREIRRLPGADRFEITTDSESGWTRYRATPPFVVSVSEKVAALRKAAPEEIEAARQRPVRIHSARELGVAPSAVGAAGSPTQVRWWKPDAPRRSPVVLGEGPLEARIGRAASMVQERWERPAADAPSVPRPPALPLTGSLAILVTDEDGRLDPEALDLLSGLRERAPRAELRALWVGPSPAPAEAERLARAGADRADRWPVPGGMWAPDGVAEALAGAFATPAPMLGGLFVSHPFGRAVAGRLAARLGCGLTGDAVGLVDEAGGLVWIKPAWGGAASAGIAARGLPHLATVRPGALVGSGRSSSTVGLDWTVHPAISPETRFERSAQDRTPDPDLARLRRAEIVVVIGRGSGGPARWSGITPILERWAAAWGATRKVVDAERIPRGRQIGLTGVSIAPRLAVLLGVGGSPNHLIGLRRAGTLLAINSDPAAPVFAGVDVGIVASVEETLPLLPGPFAFLDTRRRPPAG